MQLQLQQSRQWVSGSNGSLLWMGHVGRGSAFQQEIYLQLNSFNCSCSLSWTLWTVFIHNERHKVPTSQLYM